MLKKRIVIVIVLATVLMEVILRFVVGLGTPVLILPDKGEVDGGFGYIPAPNQDVRRFFARNTINKFSMRCDDISASKVPGHTRILFVGDSVTYGTTYIDQGRIFTSLLARDLPKRIGRPTDVLNASAGGWAPANEVGFLKTRGTFDADLVLIVLNTADLNQRFASFEPQPNMPTEPPSTAIGEMWTRYIAPRIFASQPVAVDPGSVASQPSDLVQETSAILKTVSEGRAYSAAHNARFGIVYVPSHSKAWDGPDYQTAKKMLLDWVRLNNVPLIDLTTNFSGHSFEEIYLERGDSHIHLAEMGHEIVAARLLSDLPNLLNQ